MAGTERDASVEIVGIKHRLTTAEEIIRELKDVIVTQNETLKEIVRLQEKQTNIDREFLQLKEDMKTDKPVVENIRSSVDKFKGAVITLSCVIGLASTLVAYVWTSERSRVDERFEKIEATLSIKAK